MKAIVTGALQPTPDDLAALETLGLEVTVHPDERAPVPHPECYEVAVCNNLFGFHNIDTFSNLKYIQLTAAGMDRVPLDRIREKGIDRTGKMSMPYMDKIIRNWYEKGVKTPMDIQREKAKWQEERDKKLPQKKNSNKNVPSLLQDEPSYDIDAFTKKALGLKLNKTKTE